MCVHSKVFAQFLLLTLLFLSIYGKSITDQLYDTDAPDPYHRAFTPDPQAQARDSESRLEFDISTIPFVFSNYSRNLKRESSSFASETILSETRHTNDSISQSVFKDWTGANESALNNSKNHLENNKSTFDSFLFDLSSHDSYLSSGSSSDQSNPVTNLSNEDPASTISESSTPWNDFGTNFTYPDGSDFHPSFYPDYHFREPGPDYWVYDDFSGGPDGLPREPIAWPTVDNTTRWGDLLLNLTSVVTTVCGSLSVCDKTYSPLDTCSACHTCKCDNNCYTRGDCCLDKQIDDLQQLLVFEKSPIEDPHRASCYRSTIDVNTTSSNHYLFVDTCSRDFRDADIVNRCVNTPSADSLHLRSSLLTDSTWPVWSSSNDTHYRNKFCAQCNWEETSSIEPWQLEFRCMQHVRPFSASSLKKILKEISDSKYCKVDFIPPLLSSL